MSEVTEHVIDCATGQAGDRPYAGPFPLVPDPAVRDREQRTAAALARLRARAGGDPVIADLLTVLGAGSG